MNTHFKFYILHFLRPSFFNLTSTILNLIFSPLFLLFFLGVINTHAQTRPYEDIGFKLISLYSFSQGTGNTTTMLTDQATGTTVAGTYTYATDKFGREGEALNIDKASGKTVTSTVNVNVSSSHAYISSFIIFQLLLLAAILKNYSSMPNKLKLLFLLIFNVNYIFAQTTPYGELGYKPQLVYSLKDSQTSIPYGISATSGSNVSINPNFTNDKFGRANEAIIIGSIDKFVAQSTYYVDTVSNPVMSFWIKLTNTNTGTSFQPIAEYEGIRNGINGTYKEFHSIIYDPYTKFIGYTYKKQLDFNVIVKDTLFTDYQLNINEWNNIILIRYKNEGVKIYINTTKKIEITGTATGIKLYESGLKLGKYFNSTSTGLTFEADELVMLNFPLTDADVQKLYNYCYAARTPFVDTNTGTGVKFYDGNACSNCIRPKPQWNTIDKCGSTLTLTAMGSAFGETNPPGTTYRWYTQSVGGVAFSTSNVTSNIPWVTPFNNETLPIYVSSYNICESNRWKVYLNHYPEPTVTGFENTGGMYSTQLNQPIGTYTITVTGNFDAYGTVFTGIYDGKPTNQQNEKSKIIDGGEIIYQETIWPANAKDELKALNFGVYTWPESRCANVPIAPPKTIKSGIELKNTLTELHVENQYKKNLVQFDVLGLTITYQSVNEITDIHVIDLLGRTYPVSENYHQINVPSPGVYLVRYYIQGKPFIHKISVS
ncbi:MAG: hypothetical protein NW207_00160 [Cytophagales bacterium]|nr:hypothetical protein [Cytophagales bacterium]